MLRVSARVNVGAAMSRIERARQAPRRAFVVALEESGTIVQAEAQRLILDGPKTGKIYKRYNPPREHQASAPGQPPANDLGWLASNIVLDRARLAAHRISIASLAAYSKPLELGTRFIRPRPYMRPAIQNTRGAVLTAFRLALARQL